MTEPSANNLRAIWFRCWLWLVAWKLELSSCVELIPRRETDGDEWAMNLRGRRRPAAYSPKYVEEVGSCELRLYAVLRSYKLGMHLTPRLQGPCNGKDSSLISHMENARNPSYKI